MTKPRALILSGYGLNCEEETKFAFEVAGASADIVHINDIIDNKKLLKKYQILAFPGGFAYGDDTGSGRAYGQKLKNHLWGEFAALLRGNRLVIGICNGFQILVSLGLLPATSEYGKQEAALLPNSSARYTVRWVDVQVQNSTPWLAGIEKLSLPIAHGEGKFFITAEILAKLKEKKQIALKYVKGEMCEYQNLPYNPTGTLEDIAGITDASGRILGLMPHPERATLFTHLPHWTFLKEKYQREGKKVPTIGPGLKLFKNAIDYFM